MNSKTPFYSKDMKLMTRFLTVKICMLKRKRRHPCKYEIAESVPKSTNDQLEKKKWAQ